MDYLLKASGIVIILFLFYTFFLKNETFFKSIRVYFLTGLIVVVLIPLIEIPVYIEAVTKQLSLLNYEEITTNKIAIENSFDWIQFLTFIYLIGITVFSIKFLLQLISLVFLLSKHSFYKKNNFYFIETSENISPFSFFNIIIYNKTQFTSNELEQIINHEKAHALQWHSFDTILAHLLVITLWFNPFVWLYKKAVQQNLEFLADSYAMQLANNQQLYQYTLLKTCGENYCTEITNNFYNSLIKKRIIMIHKNKSTNKNQWKYILLLPIFIAFVMTFNTKVIAQEKNLIEVNNLMIELIIDKNSSDANLEKESTTFKNEANIDLTFKGIKRNSENEITAIKIEAKGDNLKAKFENTGTAPIKPIKISYDSENNSVNIGNLNKIHKSHYTYEIHGDTELKGKTNKDGNYVLVSSDGEINSWTSKDSDTVIHKNIIIRKSYGNNENAEGKEINEIKIIGYGKTTETIHTDEIIIESDNASENVFIIKKGDDSIEQKEEKIIVLNSGNNNEKPLYMLNGKEISNEVINSINSNSIKSINVLKGEKATEKYGKKGENGVIEITTKKLYNVTINADENDVSTNLTKIASDNNPLFILNGKEISKQEMDEINPDSIESVSVLKGESAIKKYGDKAKDGVVEIISKKK